MSQDQKESNIIIPEIIEENREDTEGRIVCNKYIRGKLLGKVNILIQSEVT